MEKRYRERSEKWDRRVRETVRSSPGGGPLLSCPNHTELVVHRIRPQLPPSGWAGRAGDSHNRDPTTPFFTWVEVEAKKVLLFGKKTTATGTWGRTGRESWAACLGRP